MREVRALRADRRGTAIALARSDRIFLAVVYGIILLGTLIVLYPLLYVLAASFSSPSAVTQGRVVIWPVEFTLAGYKQVLAYQRVGIGYRNTIFYTLAGTTINVFVTLICAYPLSRKGLPHRNFFTFLFAFTMMFGGGLMPTYLLLNRLGMVNTVWAILIPGALSAYQMIVVRTFFASTIPDDLLESAKIDGCNDYQFFWYFVLPLSTAVIAVIGLQYAVGHWNSYFSAMIYLQNPDLYPLQVFLREILVMSQIDTPEFMDDHAAEAIQSMKNLIKYALIVVSTAPILSIYPLIQKYFVKGVMIGSIKG
ncbi:MAG TPA: carbohydrate ABC transporter permease [Clostridiaceae bacterium]|nr:carbohydrate ABC transporter permease [Clostridiaceae bacterium]